MAISFDRLFSTDSAKAAKALGYGFLNAIHYLAPADTGGGGDLCAHASPGCLALCLGWYSGHASMVADLEAGSNVVREARIEKARLFMHDRAFYLEQLEKQIRRLQKVAAREQLTLCVRLNGSSDIPFERMRYGPDRLTLLERFPDVQFVDYTKNVTRMGKAPPNLHLTFSRSEINEADCIRVLRGGDNVAVVFAGVMPDTWNGFSVISGDKHDLRHLDPRGGFVIGLTPKGRKARADQSGFVVRDHQNAPLALAA
jgi:hypothetical protein